MAIGLRGWVEVIAVGTVGLLCAVYVTRPTSLENVQRLFPLVVVVVTAAAVMSFPTRKNLSDRRIVLIPFSMMFVYVVCSGLFASEDRAGDALTPSSAVVILSLVLLATGIVDRNSEDWWSKIATLWSLLAFLCCLLLTVASWRSGDWRLVNGIRGKVNPNDVSNVVAVFAVLAWTGRSKAKERVPLLVQSATLAATGWIVGLSTSITAIAGLIGVALIACVIVGASKKPVAEELASSSLLLGGVLAGVGVATLLTGKSVDRFLAAGPRSEIYSAYFEFAADAPIFGHGFLTPTSIEVAGRTRSHAHNIPIHVLTQGGVVGLLLFGAVAGVTLWIACRMREVSMLPILLGVAVAPMALSQKGPLLHWEPSFLILWIAPVLAAVALAPTRDATQARRTKEP